MNPTVQLTFSSCPLSAQVVLSVSLPKPDKNPKNSIMSPQVFVFVMFYLSYLNRGIHCMIQHGTKWSCNVWSISIIFQRTYRNTDKMSTENCQKAVFVYMSDLEHKLMFLLSWWHSICVGLWRSLCLLYVYCCSMFIL